jgi:hypothetical protein
MESAILDTCRPEDKTKIINIVSLPPWISQYPDATKVSIFYLTFRNGIFAVAENLAVFCQVLKSHL